MRELFHSPTGPLPDVFTLQHPVITSLSGPCVLMAIFVPLVDPPLPADGPLSYWAPCRSSRSLAASPR